MIMNCFSSHLLSFHSTQTSQVARAHRQPSRQAGSHFRASRLSVMHSLRRPATAVAAASAVASALALHRTSSLQSEPFSPFNKSIAELQDAMAAGTASARSLAEFHILRILSIDRAGPRINAVTEINPDALATADRLDAERQLSGSTRGPLHGIPVLVKDNIDTGDLMATSAGSLMLLESRPAGDAHVISLLKAQGAVILGKTNLSEWANFRGAGSHSGWSAVGGQTRNPHVLDRSPIGSSSGSAAAVAAGLCPVALGTETDGSIVAPAHANGICGIKPSVGLTSRFGVIPISSSQDSVGTFGRTVADAAMLLEAIVGQDERDAATRDWPEGMCVSFTAHLIGVAGLRGKRVGVVREPFYSHDRRCAEVCDAAVAALEREGCTVVAVDLGPACEPAGQQRGQQMDGELLVLTYELRRELNRYLGTRVPFAEDGVDVASGGLKGAPAVDEAVGAGTAGGRCCRTLEGAIEYNKAHGGAELALFGQGHFEAAEELAGRGADTAAADARYAAALASNHRCSRAEGLDRALDEHRLDVLLAPSGPPAWETQPHPNGERHAFFFGSSGPAAVAGYPLVSVPAGTWQVGRERLPMNVTFMGRRFDEARLLQVAHGFEEATRARVEPRYATTMDVEAAFR